jgi:hypothetical protein
MTLKSTERAARRSGNGLKLRPSADGSTIRPRWEPWPAARAAGLKGRDLRDLSGAWLARGAAMDAADARSIWARAIIATHGGDEQARAGLAEAVAALAAPADPAAITRAALLDDLFEAARAAVSGIKARPTIATPATAPTDQPWRAWTRPRDVPAALRTMAALLDLWSRDMVRGAGARSATTQAVYAGHIRRITAACGSLRVAAIDALAADDLAQAWAAERTPGMARMMVAVCSSAWTWGRTQGWTVLQPWSGTASAGALGTRAGRVAIWPPALTQAFASFCDGQGFPDVADAVILSEWTGQRPWDCCLATMAALAGPTWRLIQHKTHKEVVVSLAATPLQARLASNRTRRQAAARHGASIGHDRFLYHPGTGLAHTTESISRRFALARSKALATGQPDLAGLDTGDQSLDTPLLQLRDCRDTFVTRGRAAGLTIPQICMASGHSEQEAETIWRASYVAALDLPALESGTILEDFTRRLAEHDANKS